ncbi:MAG: nucleotidyltransferase substrate binding protein [Parachlamydiaceae bacterium]|nr:nucleotidyltransferase substrate binding protein [Parachlamydiaceae bacterium]
MREGFIEDAEKWFDFLKMRNLTVHTYEESEADKVISIFPSVSAEIKEFLSRIGVKDAFH